MTHTQLNLEPYTARYLSIEAAFVEFDAKNPHVYTALVELARQERASGATWCSMKYLFEKLRKDTSFRTRFGEFKLNNNFTRPYSRKIMEQEFGFKGFFRTRKSICD